MKRVYFITTCVLMLLYAAGCSGGTSTRVNEDVIPGEQIEAVENGLSPRFLPKGEPKPGWSIAERMAHYEVPGVSVAVLVDGRFAWAKGYGVLDSETSQPVDTESVFQAASISKPVSSIGVLRLVERGLLDLDAPVNDRLTTWKIPENAFTARQPVTLRHLLSHRAGTTVHGFPGYAAGAPIPTLVQILSGTPPANTPAVVVDKTPGESYRYSGGGMTVMQLLVEEVTGEGFASVITREVLEPAGMIRSHFRHPVDEANAARAHAGPNSVPVIGHSHSYPELAAAGLWTTPTDLTKIGMKVVEALQGQAPDFLSREMARQMLTPIDDYGLGFGVIEAEDGLVFLHNGGNHGFRARWFTYADGRGSVAVMTNADNSSPLIREITSAIAESYGWSFDAATEREVVTLSADQIQDITGTYLLDPNDRQSEIEVTHSDGDLWIDTPFFERSKFFADTDTSFFTPGGMEFILETDDSGQPVAIVINGEGRATRVRE